MRNVSPDNLFFDGLCFVLFKHHAAFEHAAAQVEGEEAARRLARASLRRLYFNR